MASKHLQDPESYNRVFMLGAKCLTEDELREMYGQYGFVKDVYFVRDRVTNERKDIAYVTFSKASEAALAIEKTNGQMVKDNPRPLKVILANSRNEGSVRDPNEDGKMLRLFIVVPKGFTEKDIRDDFSKYGEIDYVRMVNDRHTGAPRGLAYVKYHRAYHAALALEGCDAHYKPVFASMPRREGGRGGRDSSSSDPFGSDRSSRYDKFYNLPEPPSRDPRDIPQARPPTDVLHAVHSYMNQGEMVLEAFMPAAVSREIVHRLFNIPPCLDYCNFDQGAGIAMAKYTSPQAAAYAKEKLDGFEYPPGYRMIVRYYKPGGMRYDAYGQDMVGSSVQAVRQGMMATVESPSTPGNVKTLVDTIQKAMSVLKQMPHGEAAISAVTGGSGMDFGDKNPVKYCSVPLPPRQPLAPSDSDVVERLFIVSAPDAYPMSFLEDCFCRFGNMIGAFFMPGKKFGYVKYASAESAHQAVERLHGQTICGNKMKVMIAEPHPKPGDKRKRDDDSFTYDDDEMMMDNKRLY